MPTDDLHPMQSITESKRLNSLTEKLDKISGILSIIHSPEVCQRTCGRPESRDTSRLPSVLIVESLHVRISTICSLGPKPV